MFLLNQAALLYVQLLCSCHVLADAHKNVLVSTGDSVMFTCNITVEVVLQINWTKDRLLFAHRTDDNQTFSTFDSHRVRIDPGFPSTLSIDGAQHNDTGLYRCEVTEMLDVRTDVWNLTVSEKHEENSSVQYQYYVLPSITVAVTVAVLLLCGITATVRCYGRSKCLATSSKKKVHFDSRTYSCAQFHVQSGGESLQTTTPQHQSCAEYNRSTRSSQNWGLYFTDVQVKAE